MPEDPSPNPSDGEKPKKLTLRLSKGAPAPGPGPESPPAKGRGKTDETPAKPRESLPEVGDEGGEPPLFIEDNPIDELPRRPTPDSGNPARKTGDAATTAGDRPAAPRLKLNRRADGAPPAPGPPDGKPAAKPWKPMEEPPPDAAKAESRPSTPTPGPAEKGPPRKPPPPIGARVIAPEPDKAPPSASKKAPPPPSAPVKAAPPETQVPAPAPESDKNNHNDIPADAVSKAIKAGKERPRKKRVVKLLTIAAGLAASTLAVWWSTDALPFFIPEPRPAPAEAPAANQTPAEAASAPAGTPTAPADQSTPGTAEPDPAVSAFVDSLRIQHVQSGEAGTRVVIGGVAYAPGGLVHERHGLRLASVDAGSRTVLFEDASGARYPLGY
ncbi:MAG: hypothetical protein JJU00_13745 [Opitutales bacterium]|nr:hypothetical protein [Opitutales bacterium]